MTGVDLPVVPAAGRQSIVSGQPWLAQCVLVDGIHAWRGSTGRCNAIGLQASGWHYLYYCAQRKTPLREQRGFGC
ncbi:hypothetical protein, partial [Stenotrophomonas maltophilia]|uniref:hypothetical protein n=1 Tax=Stenotrophomonas maltophilia TaxID=40324 RepID=UPI001C658564